MRFNGAAFTRNSLAFGQAKPVQPAAASPVRATAVDGGYVLENSLVRVAINAQGLLTSAVDLATGRETIAAGQEANLLQLHQDFPNMWDAWDVDKYYRNQVTDVRELDSLELSSREDGSQVVTIARSFSQSTLVQELSLAPGSRPCRSRRAPIGMRPRSS